MTEARSQPVTEIALSNNQFQWLQMNGGSPLSDRPMRGPAGTKEEFYVLASGVVVHETAEQVKVMMSDPIRVYELIAGWRKNNGMEAPDPMPLS